MGCGSSVQPRLSCKLNPCNFFDEYSLGGKLGSGSFGQVRAVSALSSGARLAVKIIAVGEEQPGKKRRSTVKACKHRQRRARQEVAVWNHLGRHEHIVELMEAFHERCMFYLVMEKCGRNLMEELLELPNADESHVARMLFEMLLAIVYVHEKRLVHRDIKPDNFLMGGSDGRSVKLCDFGMTVLLRDPPLFDVCGTTPYKSPEMLQGTGYDQKTDIWSFGVTAYLLLYGEFPYAPHPRYEEYVLAVEEAIKCGLPPPRFARVSGGVPPSKAAGSFVRTVLQRRPRCRCTAEEAHRLDFVAQAGSHENIWHSQPQLNLSRSQSEVTRVISLARQLTANASVMDADARHEEGVDEVLHSMQVAHAQSGHGPDEDAVGHAILPGFCDVVAKPAPRQGTSSTSLKLRNLPSTDVGDSMSEGCDSGQ